MTKGNGKWLNAKQACELLGVSRTSFHIYCRAGKFQTAFKIRGTAWVVDSAEINAIIRGKKAVDFSGAWGAVYD